MRSAAVDQRAAFAAVRRQDRSFKNVSKIEDRTDGVKSRIKQKEGIDTSGA
jgi:hypothetical protein